MNAHETRIAARTRELIAHCAKACASFPPGYAFLTDQTRRASSSVMLNFFEGCGRETVDDRRKYLDIARASAREVQGALESAHAFGILDAHLRDEGCEIADHVARMLSRFH